jgi:lactobin A/cerein 7B family class IIb bacteriocin
MQQTSNLHSATDLEFSPEPEELSIEQLDDVNGGILPVVAAFAAGLAIGWLARGQ